VDKVSTINFKASANGDNTIVAAVAGTTIKVLALHMQPVAGTTTINYYFSSSNAAGTALYGDATNPIPLDRTEAAGPSVLSLPPTPFYEGWMETDEGEGLNLNLSGAQPVSGVITYMQ